MPGWLTHTNSVYNQSEVDACKAVISLDLEGYINILLKAFLSAVGHYLMNI